MLDVLDRLTRARKALPAARPHLRDLARGLRGAAALLELALGDERTEKHGKARERTHAPPAGETAPPPARARSKRRKPARPTRGRRPATPAAETEAAELLAELVARTGSVRQAAALAGVSPATASRIRKGGRAEPATLEKLRSAVAFEADRAEGPPLEPEAAEATSEPW